MQLYDSGILRKKKYYHLTLSPSIFQPLSQMFLSASKHNHLHCFSSVEYTY